MELSVGDSKVNPIYKLILVAVILLLIIGGGYIFKNKYIYKADDIASYNYKVQDLSYVVEKASDDTDGDGMANWRENLLGTDPNSSNSNAVGVYGFSSSTISNDNLTEQVAISLYASANALRAAGDTSTPATMAMTSAIADQALVRNAPEADSKKIIIINNNSREALRVYGNSLLGYIIVYYPKVNESQVLNLYYKNGDKAVLKDMQVNVDSLELMLSELYKVKVPSAAYEIHLLTLNTILKAIQMEKSLIKADTDALPTMIAFKEWQGFTEVNKAIMSKYKDFFNAHNVVFGVHDAGNIINQQ